MGMLSFWWYLYFSDWAEVSSHGHQCHRWVLSWRPLSFGVHSPLCHEVPPPNYKDLPGAPAPLGGRDAFRYLSPALWVGKSHLAAPLLPSWPWTSVGVLYYFGLHWMVRFMFPLLPDPRIVPGVSSLSPAHIHRPPTLPPLPSQHPHPHRQAQPPQVSTLVSSSCCRSPSLHLSRTTVQTQPGISSSVLSGANSPSRHPGSDA